MPRALSKPQRRPKPRWQRRKQARPTEIVAAALDVFVERGFAATRLEEVARRAGVTKGTLYLYFDGKAALFKAVVRENLVPFLTRAEQAVAQDTGSARELLGRLLRETWRVLVESPLSGLPKLILSEAGNFPEVARFWFAEVVRPGHELLVRVLQRGVDAGEFRPVDVRLAARAAIAPIIHLAVLKHSLYRCVNEPMDISRYADTHVDLFLHGVARTPRAEPSHV